ncbi:MAG: flagellar basal body rod protein FlgC [Syntrophus sp. (in: bacteria)]|nr:flagellar basal body rod protein FlgC [Syntrophus sp. (in: bacteria)]
MDISSSFGLCGSALTAQRAKMDVITSNLANADVTRTPEGGPYRKKSVVLTSEPVKDKFDKTLRDALKTVRVAEVTEDASPPRLVHNPSHPDADANGFVAMPNVNIMSEMADMIAVSRAYEAMVTAFDATKNMALKTLEMGK